MDSVADELRSKTREQVLEMSVPEQVACGFRLGEEDLEMQQESLRHGRDSAIHHNRRQRQQGRQRSG